MKLRNLFKKSAFSKHLKTYVFPRSLGEWTRSGRRPACRDPRAALESPGLVWFGRKSDSPTAEAGAALGGSAVSLPLRRGSAGTRLRETFQDRGAPAAWPSPAAPGPPWKGLNFGPRSADTRGSVNAMTSPLGSAAQQEMLSASPLPARRKWGSFFPAAGPPRPLRPTFGAACAGSGRRGRGGAPGKRDPEGEDALGFAMAHFADSARGLHGAEKTECRVTAGPGESTSLA